MKNLFWLVKQKITSFFSYKFSVEKLKFKRKNIRFSKTFKIKLNFKQFIIVLLVFSIALAVVFYLKIFKDLPNPNLLRDYKVTPLSTHIYDRNGRLLYEVYRDENRTAVKLQDLPEYVKQATIAIEDKDFYKHNGVSPIGGILRATKEILLKQELQGGSTITQQLIKTSLLTPERTIERKIKEIILALWAERIYSKDEILQMYLNQIPYGGSAYGIEEASQLYFEKSAKDLSLEEAALLAGLPKAPSLYSPYNDIKLAKARRDTVLKAMYEQGYINKDRYEESIKTEVKVKPAKIKIKAPHFVFYVRQKLEEMYGRDMVEEGGLRVYTSLDLQIQEEAERIVKEEIEKVKDLNVSNGAVLVTRPSTGEILAMVGSVDFFATPSGSYNVTTALRQPGSSIKPLNYAVGLENRIVTPASVFIDAPTCFIAVGQPKSYCPVNYDGQFHGPTALRFALANSYNIPAVKMLALNGVEEFIASTSAFGIDTFKDPNRYGLSLTLGGGEVRMTDMAEAYGVFANQGVRKDLVSIIKVVDKLGKTVYEYKDPNFEQDIHKNLKPPKYLAIEGRRVISKETAYLISHILLDNNARSQAFGFNSDLVIKGKAVSVKTGTTNNLRDNWTIGYTPNFLTAVWVGNNDNSPMKGIASGLTGASSIWNRVISYVLKDQEDLWPTKPEDVVGAEVCVLSGLRPNPESPCQTRFEYFIKGTEPTAVENLKRVVPVNRDTDQLTKTDDPSVEMREKLIIEDPFGLYCLDCNNQNLPVTTVNVDKLKPKQNESNNSKS
ncbi:MAG: penicillin-binding protein 1A [Patescibacteria group bacterium]|nr:MAG: penicillin-binding protein 1A [Patescibacteria group bacterium]